MKEVFSLPKLQKYARICWRGFCVVFFAKKHLKRDSIALGALAVLLLLVVVGNKFNYSEQISDFKTFAGKYSMKSMLGKIKMPEFGRVAGESTDIIDPGLSEEQVQEDVKIIQETVDTSNWKNYQSQWYGIALKYPDQWLEPVHKSAVRGGKWEYRSQFRIKNVSDENPYLGFDLVIYNLAAIKEATNTDEFPKLRSDDLKNNETCSTIDGHLIETGDYPAEEVNVPVSDDCYNPALYFSFVRDAYVYNIIPVVREGYDRASDPMVDVMDHFPEFFSVASEWKIIDMVRPKPKPVVAAATKPRVTGAPMPYVYKKVNGLRVCKKKNDHPSKSKTHKKGHMDMECCLDPDEIPNPNCYYDPKKYGKYL